MGSAETSIYTLAQGFFKHPSEQMTSVNPPIPPAQPEGHILVWVSIYRLNANNILLRRAAGRDALVGLPADIHVLTCRRL